MIVSRCNTTDKSRNLLVHSVPTKRILVENGIVNPEYATEVADILQSTGLELTPLHRRGTYEAPKPTLVKAKRVKSSDIDVVVIPATDTEPEECIPLHKILEAEQVLADEYEESARQYDRPDREVMGRKAA